MCRCERRAEAYNYCAGLYHQLAVRITPSLSPSSSGTKPLPPHVGHCCSSSVPFSMMPSPLQSGQVFTCASLWDTSASLSRTTRLAAFPLGPGIAPGDVEGVSAWYDLQRLLRTSASGGFVIWC